MIIWKYMSYKIKRIGKEIHDIFFNYEPKMYFYTNYKFYYIYKYAIHVLLTL